MRGKETSGYWPPRDKAAKAANTAEELCDAAVAPDGAGGVVP